MVTREVLFNFKLSKLLIIYPLLIILCAICLAHGLRSQHLNRQDKIINIRVLLSIVCNYKFKSLFNFYWHKFEQCLLVLLEEYICENINLETWFHCYFWQMILLFSICLFLYFKLNKIELLVSWEYFLNIFYIIFQK